MTPDRLQTIQNDALDEAQWAHSILESEIDSYDDFTAARIVQRLCEYIAELVNTIKTQNNKLADLGDVQRETNTALADISHELAQCQHQIAQLRTKLTHLESITGTPT